MGLFRYLMSGDSRKSLKKLSKMADRVEALAPRYEAMSDAELRGQTELFRERLKKGETLDDILYEAFAALREASGRVLNMKHFHVQIMGGICLYQGRIAEMKTGEGKTFVATLPSYLEGLSGKGVHIVTVNDYLARRDAEWMGKVHKFMGLTVGVVVPGMDDNAKRAAYACDITYGTNNEFGFDYLRDNLKNDLKLMVQRELNFVIVDEVDSILIDEARTPLIISGKGQQSSALYERVDQFVRTLKGGFDDDLKDAEEQQSRRKKSKDSGAQKLAAAEALAWDYVVERKEKQVRLTEYGAEKAERFFGVENIADLANASLNHHIQQALKAHNLFHLNEEYIINNGEIVIVDEFTGRLMIGRRYSDGLHQAIEAKEGVKVREENKTYATITFQNYFRLYRKLSGMTGTAKTEEGEFRTIYSLDVIEIPTNRPVRRRDMPDRVYSTVEGKKRAIVREIVERHKNGQPILVGTVSVDKSEEISRLLIRNGVPHNILNAKNHEREAEIVAQAGRYGAVTIATNMAGRGTDILLGGNPEYLAKKRLREEGVDREVIERAASFTKLDDDEESDKVIDRYNALYRAYKEKTDEEKRKVVEAGGLCIIGTERHESRRIDNQLRGRSGRQGDVGVSIFFLSLEDDLMVRFGGERMKRIYAMSKMEEDECLDFKILTNLIEYAQKQIEGRNFGIRKNVLQYDDVMNTQRTIMYAERMRVIRGENVHDQILKYIPGYVENVVKETVNTEQMPDKWSEDDLNAALERHLIPEGTHYVTREKLEKWDVETALRQISKKTEKCYEEKIARIKEEMPVVDFSKVERDVLLSYVNSNWIDHIDAMDQLRKGIGLRAYGQSDPVIAYKQEGFAMFDEMIERIQERTIRFLLKCQIKAEQRPVQRIFPSANRPAAPQAAAQQNASTQPVQQSAQQNAPAQPVQQPVQQNAPAQPAQQSARQNADETVTGTEALPQAVNVDALRTGGDVKFNPATMKKGKKIGPNDPCPCGSGLKYKKCHGKPY